MGNFVTLRPHYIALLVLIGLSLPASASCSKKLLLGYADWHRGAVDFETERKYYIDLELSEHIFRLSGCDFELKALPLPRLLKSIERGEVDGTMGASITPERKAYAWFSAPYRNEEIVMFMRNEELGEFWPVSHVELATSGLRIGMALGAWYGPELDALQQADPIFKASILKSDNLEIVFDWLLQKRVDIVVEEVYTGLKQLKRSNATELVSIHPFIINSAPVHIMLSQSTVSVDDVRIINKAIQEFRASPDYGRILSEYRVLADR